MSNNYGYTRRIELKCTIEEMNENADVILYDGESIYIKQQNGEYAIKVGDGKTRLIDLPYAVGDPAVRAAEKKILSMFEPDGTSIADKAKQLAGLEWRRLSGMIRCCDYSYTKLSDDEVKIDGVYDMSFYDISGCLDTGIYIFAVIDKGNYLEDIDSVITGDILMTSLVQITYDECYGYGELRGVSTDNNIVIEPLDFAADDSCSLSVGDIVDQYGDYVSYDSGVEDLVYPIYFEMQNGLCVKYPEMSMIDEDTIHLYFAKIV